MNKAFLALKTVTLTDGKFHSIWIGGSRPELKTVYEVGKRVRCCRPELPFFLCSANRYEKESELVCGCSYSHVMIVRVLKTDIRDFSPWVMPKSHGIDLTKVSSLENNYVIMKQGEWVTTESLLPLEFHAKSPVMNLGKIVSEAKKKYKLPLLAASAYSSNLFKTV